jgi:SAM-dependent methyltransferase
MEHIYDRLPQDVSLFDLISFTSSGVQNMFRESFRILKHGGRLLITTPNANSLDAIANIIRGKRPYNYAPHVREYTPQDVVRIALEAGFVLEKRKTSSPWHVHSDDFLDQLYGALEGIGIKLADFGSDALFSFIKP